MIMVYPESWLITFGVSIDFTKKLDFSVGKKSFLGGMSKWLQLYLGGYGQMITVLNSRGGGSLGTPKSEYVICARPLSCHQIRAQLRWICGANCPGLTPTHPAACQTDRKQTFSGQDNFLWDPPPKAPPGPSSAVFGRSWNWLLWKKDVIACVKAWPITMKKIIRVANCHKYGGSIQPNYGRFS